MTRIVVMLGNAPQGWDALLRKVDECAADLNATGFAQVGGSAYLPVHLEARPFVEQLKLRRLLQDADVVITHGGVGSIGECLRFARRFVVVPRAADPKSAVGDQIAVARRLGRCYAFPVVDLPDLDAALRDMLTHPPRAAVEPHSNVSSLVQGFLDARARA